MIWSVSTSARLRAVTPPLIVFTGSISPLRLRSTSPLPASPRLVCSFPIPDVHEVPFDGGRGGHLGADEVRAPAAALAALEVAVRGGGAALAGLQDVRVHAQAHRAAGGPPVEPGGAEHLVEAL